MKLTVVAMIMIMEWVKTREYFTYTFINRYGVHLRD